MRDKEKQRGNFYQIIGRSQNLLPKESHTGEEGMSVRIVRGYNRTGRKEDRGVYTFVQETIQGDKGKVVKRYILTHDTLQHETIVRGFTMENGYITSFVGYHGDESTKGTPAFAVGLLRSFVRCEQFAIIGEPHGGIFNGNLNRSIDSIPSNVTIASGGESGSLGYEEVSKELAKPLLPRTGMIYSSTPDELGFPY